MARVNLQVTVTGTYEYKKPRYYAGYGMDTVHIYKMQDEDGKVYVWKTTSYQFGIEIPDETGCIIRDNKTFRFEFFDKGDIINITATVKGESEYNGEQQTEISRVKVNERVFRAKRWGEIQKEREAVKLAKKEEQIKSLTGGDFIWEMPYKQFKEHYSDCETIEGSFTRHDRRPATISVIVREGRLKNSGVRGEHYSGFEFFFDDADGKRTRVCYRAIKEENALKRIKKDFPEATNFEAGKIYTYD